jgi:hypothetical protein
MTGFGFVRAGYEGERAQARKLAVIGSFLSRNGSLIEI